MTRENAAEKARRYLLNGRLIVTQVQPGHVRATTRGDGHQWHQAYDDNGWTCDCPARTANCAHLIALRTVIAMDIPTGRP